VHELVKKGADVHIVMTKAACSFITPYTFEVLSKNPVRIGMFDEPINWKIEHIDLAVKMDLMVIAPATAI